MKKPKSQCHLLPINRQCFGDRLNRLITMGLCSICTGVIARALLRYPGENNFPFIGIDLPSPVQSHIAGGWHGFVLHYPLNFIQVTLCLRPIFNQGVAHRFQVEGGVTQANIVFHQLFGDGERGIERKRSGRGMAVVAALFPQQPQHLVILLHCGTQYRAILHSLGIEMPDIAGQTEINQRNSCNGNRRNTGDFFHFTFLMKHCRPNNRRQTRLNRG
ncbi:hypothetical protein D3C73_852170 [compost metagenome]